MVSSVDIFFTSPLDAFLNLVSLVYIEVPIIFMKPSLTNRFLCRSRLPLVISKYFKMLNVDTDASAYLWTLDLCVMEMLLPHCG